MYGDMQPAEVNDSAPAMQAVSSGTAPQQVMAARNQNQNQNQNNTLQNSTQPVSGSESRAKPVVQTEDLPQPEPSQTIAEQPSLDQIATSHALDTPATGNRELVDQSGHVEFIEMDINSEFPETGFVQHDQPAAANSGMFDSVVMPEISNDRGEIVVDDFFDEVDGRNNLDAHTWTQRPEPEPIAAGVTPETQVAASVTTGMTEPAYLQDTGLADTRHNNVQDSVGYTPENQYDAIETNETNEAIEAIEAIEETDRGETHNATNAIASNEDGYQQEYYAQSNDADNSFAEQPYEESSYTQAEQPQTADLVDEIPELPADATEIDHLAHAMNSVSGEAVKLQDSVLKINELHEQEQYYRTQLNGARLAYEKAQEAQFETYTYDLGNAIKAGEKKLHSEQANSKNLEVNLEDKRRALLQAELRVTELESELSARQQVFHDQMASLEKTKEMARNAAQLARRAAVMQQRARTTALQERAKRERLEVSAKKAVNIARNAISKLAEEERKNSSSRGLH